MCTAITYLTKDFYFGRTLDYEHSFGESVVLTPRRFPLQFRHSGERKSHYAMLGIARVESQYPLYFDGFNEKGVAMAGLNFVGNAYYGKPVPHKQNIAQFELIPWILSQCDCVDEAAIMLQQLQLTDDAFSSSFPPAQLHWIIADRSRTVVVESMTDGLHIYDDPLGVLTNNPSFPEQMHRLEDYLHLTTAEPENRLFPGLPVEPCSRGMGMIGLPGDLSSQSRFVRAAAVKWNSISGESEEESISQFFHILGAVQQQRGCCRLGHGQYEITRYTSCCNVDKGIYYYTTYGNQQITAVDMHNEDLEGDRLTEYPILIEQRIHLQNPARRRS